MSNKILNLVRDARLGDPTMKEVLKVIADQSNDAGTGVWSSYAYIAWCIERGRSTVIEKCNQLRDRDILSVRTRPGATNLWSISTDALEDIGEKYRSPIEVNEIGSPEPGLDQSSPKTPVVQPQDPSPLEPLKEPQTLGAGYLNAQDVEKPQEEPTYINEVDGVPEEWLMEWGRFLDGWKYCFPEKAQPRKSNTKLRNKFKTRFADEGFRARWDVALMRTKDLKWAKKEGWFKAGWFLHNDENYLKLLDGTFDFKTSEKVIAEETETTRRKATSDHGGDLEEFKKANPGGT